ncbi:hypothetical protein NL676_035694 [Syzygium grande]|nr:hypothetical protein NL676_035694 [Syzygium grande]
MSLVYSDNDFKKLENVAPIKGEELEKGASSGPTEIAFGRCPKLITNQKREDEISLISSLRQSIKQNVINHTPDGRSDDPTFVLLFFLYQNRFV